MSSLRVLRTPHGRFEQSWVAWRKQLRGTQSRGRVAWMCHCRPSMHTRKQVSRQQGNT